METRLLQVNVNIPSVEDVAGKYRAYGRHAREEGSFLFDLVMSPESFFRTRIATDDLDLPAVAGIAKLCAEAAEKEGVELDGYQRQYVGALVCTLMEANGYRKTGSKKAIPHPMFTKGEVYIRDGDTT